MAGGKASAKKIELAERRRLAVTLRKQGGTFRQIAEQLRKVDGVSENYSQSDAYKDVVHELRRLEEEQAEDVLTLRRLELERLDEMWSALWGPFKKGDYAAFDRLVTVMNQRGRYLPVFDQSDKTTNVNLAGGLAVTTETVEMSDAELANKLLALLQGTLLASGQEMTITDGSRQAEVGGPDRGPDAGAEGGVEGVAT